VCDQETSKTRRLKHATGLWQYKQKCCDVRNTNKQQQPWGIKLSGLVWSTDDFTAIQKRLTTWIYRVSQAECARLLERVPYVKLYRYNPKNLRVYPKLNGYGDNGQRSLKLWQLLHTYWLSNTYWNWQEYVVSVMLISVLNIKVTCEWHKAIKLNYKNTRTTVVLDLRFSSTLRRSQLFCYLVTSELPCADCSVS